MSVNQSTGARHDRFLARLAYGYRCRGFVVVRYSGIDRIMKLGSFCTGIGGLDIAVEQVFNAEPVWFCEYDQAPSKVLAYHWPHVPNHGDLTATDWATVEPVDIVTAGYPCQPFSTAGQRQGTEDERHLWPAIRDAISVLGPSIVCLENVRGHLSLGFDAVLGDLTDLGFHTEWGITRSSDVGAPHRRERLFVVAYRRRRDGSTNNDLAIAHASGPVTDSNSEPARRDTGTASRTETWREDEPCRSDRDGSAYGNAAVVDWGKYTEAVRRWERVFGTAAPAPLIDGRSLNPELPEWMMGYPSGWVTDPAIGLTRAQQLKAVGNSVQSQAAFVVVRGLAVRAGLLQAVAA